MAGWRDYLGGKRAGGRSTQGEGPVFQPRKSTVQQRRVKVHPTRGIADNDVGVGDQFRVVVTMFMLTLCFAIVGARLAFVALMPPVEPRASIREMPKEALRRGNIYDRNGILVAATLKVYSLYADPKRVLDPEEAANKIPTVLPDVDPVHLLSQLTDPTRRFIWVKRRMTPDEAARVNALGLPGFEFREEFVRVYPHREMAGHLLGAVDVDNNGLAGVERAFDAQLKRGEDIHLALDVRLQELLRQRILEAVEKTGSKAGWGMVMFAPTREIVALVSLPDFDPNHFGEATPEQRFNRVTLGSYEMGSTFKLFTLAQGLDSGKITPQTLIDCRTPISIGKFTIGDFHAKKAMLTAEEVLRYSSNIGAAKIADINGPEAQKAFMEKLGLLAPMNVGVAEVGNVRYPANWGRVQEFTIAFGHGIMVTPVHMVNAVAALADGMFKVPSVLKGGAVSDTSTHGVVALQTLPQLHDLMRDVVLNGSGRSAQLVGYDLGGKTGTAEKITGRGYDKTKNLVSFVGILPTKDPQYVTLVMLDEPQPAFALAARSAAPAVGAFYRDLVQLESVPPDMGEVAAFRDLLRKSKQSESNPWSQYLLSDMRMKRGSAGGVPLKVDAKGDSGSD